MVTIELGCAPMGTALLKIYIIITACTVRPSTQEGTFNDHSQFDTSTREEVDRFLSCPLNYAGLQTECSKWSSSCCRRCGTFIEDYPDYPFEDYISCSCDEKCPIYRDCCWDFESVCPEVMVRSAGLKNLMKSLTHAKLDCVHGTVVFTYPDEIYRIGALNITDSSYNNGEEDTAMWEKRDFREPIIDMKGFQFMNISVYKYYFHEHLNFTYVAWQKRLTMLYWPSQKVFEEFFLEGKASNEIQDGLEDVPPAGIKRRLCKAGVYNVKCSKCPQTVSELTVSETVFQALCKRVFSNFTNVFAIASNYSGIEMGVSTDVTHSLILTDYARVTGPSTQMPHLSTDSVVCNYDKQGLYVCTTWFYKDLRRNYGNVFSVVMAFSQALGVDFKRFRADKEYNWKSFEYIQNGQGGTKQLLQICNSGFVFNGDSCIKPHTFFVRIMHDIDGARALLGLIDLFKQLIQAIDQFQTTEFEIFTGNGDIFENVWVQFVNDEATKNNYITSETELNIKNYDLPYNGTILPMTDRIIEFIRKEGNGILVHNDDSSNNSDQILMWMCLVLHSTSLRDDPGNQEEKCVCDRIWWDRHEILVVHERFGDVSNLSIWSDGVRNDARNGFIAFKESLSRTQNRWSYDDHNQLSGKAQAVANIELVMTTMVLLSLTLVLPQPLRRSV